jgi:hypothetical protein
MQTNLRRGKAASRARSAALSVAIAASASIVATFSFFVPSPALAAPCGGTHISGAHGASAGNGGMHTATSIAAPSGGGGGGGGSLGCANGSSAMALRGLPTAASGRVVEGGTAGRREAHTRTAPTRTNNTTAHLHTVRPAHRG